MRQKIAAGNWKMNTTLSEGLELASEVINMAMDEVGDDVTIVLNVPYTHLTSIRRMIEGRNMYLGAQNCHEEDKGAFTGEISAEMLEHIHVDYVILGHSERRALFAETNAQLAKKVDAALTHNLIPIFCCGEKLDERKAKNHFEVVRHQLHEGLFHLSGQAMKKVVIAYEPVWAIGTGVTASADQAQEMHAFIRELIKEQYDDDIAAHIPVLYGGSVKPANAGELFACPDVDGGLIGGASLSSRDFVDIAKAF